MEINENKVLCSLFGVVDLVQVSKREAMSAAFVLRMENFELLFDLYQAAPNHPRFAHLTDEQRREIEIASIEYAKTQAVTL